MLEFKIRIFDPKLKKFNSELSIEQNGLIFKCGEIGYRNDCIINLYIGLTDHKGKEIYEGDVIQFNNAPLSSSVIITFCDGMFGWLDPESGFSPLAGWDAENSTKIIGNIYENPELLTIPRSNKRTPEEDLCF